MQPPLRSKTGMGTTSQQGLVCKNGRKAAQVKPSFISLVKDTPNSMSEKWTPFVVSKSEHYKVL